MAVGSGKWGGGNAGRYSISDHFGRERGRETLIGQCLAGDQGK